MAFNGYLIRLIGANNVYTAIPLDYIRYETYSVTPNQRLDLDTGLRDLTGVMHRVVVDHTASKVEFNTVLMNNTRMNALINLIMSNVRSYLERDVYMQYYCPDSDSYKTGHFYVPDIEYKIRNIDTRRNIINYEEVRIAFIEY